MPTYEYECKLCSTVRAIKCSIADRNRDVQCETCGSVSARVLSASFIRTSIKKALKAVSPTQNTASSGRGSTAIRVEGRSSGQISNCRFEGFDTGISASSDSSISMTGNEFSNVKKPIEITDD